MHPNPLRHFIRDTVIVIATILFATYLYRSGALSLFLEATENLGPLRIFVAGLFFTSIFTTAFAISTIIALGGSYDPLLVALLGGVGALLGDLLIFRFFKSNIVEDIDFILSHTGLKKVLHAVRLKSMRWFITSLGALIIASPFPDEIGLAMMGISGVPTKFFIPISYTLNALGIFVLASVGALVA